MPYIKEICKCGKVIEINKYFSSRYKHKEISRGKKQNFTAEQQKKVNERQAVKKLRRLVNTNFSENDMHCVLTYRREDRPSPKKAKTDLDKFLRKLRNEKKKSGAELKYIAVTEYENKSIHHHIIINYTEPKIITSLWSWGRVRISLLDNTGDYSLLSEYLIKETSKTFNSNSSPCGKRWRQSQNLKMPQIKKEIVKADSWREEPKPLKCHSILKNSLITGYHEITGYMYQSYSMVRIN